MFRTELSLAPATDQLSRTARVLTLGSCFADSIGSRLTIHKVETLANPFGTVFQPLALVRLLRAAAGEEVDWQRHLVEKSGRWMSYDLHSSIGAASPVELLQTIQELVRQAGDFLRRTDLVLLTLGTAWAYRLRETGELVSNCHKQPADMFVRELLTPDEIINALAETHAYVRRINPSVRFVLTVSPVRHLKDTLPLNSVSKSVLRLATHIVSDLLPGVAYFPAYELLTDDLRDYRFYASDMLHPSEVAEDYIWEKFARTYFDADFGRFRKDWAAIRQALGHRPLHEGAPEHRQFLENTLEKLEQLSLRKVDVRAETATVRTQLAALPIPPPVVEVLEDDDEERIDIGDVAGGVTASAGSAPAARIELPADGPKRLSPEEFRAQRNNRPERGRRDGREHRDQRNEREAAHEIGQEQISMPSSAIESPSAEQPTASLLGLTETADTRLASMPELPSMQASTAPGAAETPESVKKKKRRSRGGAKRTARKHALLAAELGQTPGATPLVEATEAPVEAAVPSGDQSQPEVKKPSVITKSVPVKRGGRRGISTQPLYAAPAANDAEAASTADVPGEVSVDLGEIQPIKAAVADSAQEPRTEAVPASRPASNRNKRKKGSRNTDVPAVSGAAEAAADAPAVRDDGRESASDAAQPKEAAVPEPTLAAAIPAEVPTPTAAPRQSNRAKRAVSGARMVKPDVDTPIIPVPDASAVRTQVAAGRMLGSSASLVKPTALPTPKVAAKAKPAPKKAAAVAKETPEKLPAPKPAAPAKKPAAKKKAVATPAVEPAAPAPKKAAATKPKPAKEKPAPAKPKAPRKPAKPA